MIALKRTDSTNWDFQDLVVHLDRYLKIKDGDDHAFYAQYNKTDAIKNVVVAYADEVAVGCGAFKKFDESTAEIKRMFVLPEYRGQGIAGKILAELEHWAKESGYPSTVLETGHKQQEAIRLYQKSGYTVTENFGPYVGVENSVCMRKG